MIAVTNEYKRQLIAGNRKWVIKIPVFLANNATSTPDFTLTNNEIWEQGVVIDQSISSDDSFDLGAAIVGSLKVVIDNISGRFSTYDFYSAKLVLWLGVEGDLDDNDDQVYYRIGFYYVDEPSYNGSLITLNCLDNMTWFDIPFSEVTTAAFPTTAGALVGTICSHVGVTLATASFPNYTTVIPIAPEGDLNCREVLQYVAQMCCCYCKINTAGELKLTWYDKTAITGLTDYDGGTYNTTTMPYSDGDDVDGGNFFDYSSGDRVDGGTFTEQLNSAFLGQNYQMEVSTDDIVVTGCRVCNSKKEDDEDAYNVLWVDSGIEQTHERYVLVIENNPFITTDNAQNIANQVGNILAGLPIRAFTATSLSDFSYETGDMVNIRDFRENNYYTWITHFVFTTNNSEQFSCGAQSIKKRSETRYSANVRTLAEAQENASKLLSDYDNAVQAMNDLAQDALGYNQYQYTVGTGIVTWLYNGLQIDTTDPERPLFSDSTVVFKISGDGVFISSDGGTTYTQGYDANSGTAILSLIYAHGITADWVHSGTLTLGGDNNVNGLCTVLDANGNEKVRMDVSGLYASGGVIIGGNINGATIRSYYNDNTNNGWTEIRGGGCTVYATNNNFFSVRHKALPDSIYVTIGPQITVNDSTVDFRVQTSLRFLGWAIYDAVQNHGSDRKLKKNIEDIPQEESIALILGARPRYYEFKNTQEGGKRSGFVAQELRETLDKVGNDSAIERESIRRKGEQEVIYEDFIAHLVNTTQFLYSEVEELKKEVAELKKSRKE